GFLAPGQAPYQVEQEDKLGSAHDQRSGRDEDVQRRRRWWDEGGLTQLVIAARYTQKTQVMHREKDRVGAQERDPEVNPAHGIVEHSAGNLGIPMVDPAE